MGSLREKAVEHMKRDAGVSIMQTINLEDTVLGVKKKAKYIH